MGIQISSRKIKTLIVLWLMYGGIVDQQHAKAQSKTYAEAVSGHPLAVVVDEVPLVHTGQFMAKLDKKDGLKDDLKKQIDQIFLQLGSTLKAAHSRIDRIVKINICLNSSLTINQARDEIMHRFAKGNQPAIFFVSGDLRDPDALLSLDAVATSTLKSDTVSYFSSNGKMRPAEGAGAAVLPKGPVVYVSGQAATGDLAEATLATLKQLEATLAQLGLKKKDVVQIKSFVQPAADVQVAERVIADFFLDETLPPLVFVEWVSKNPIVEIELIAASPPAAVKQQLEFITPDGMTASPIYAKVCRMNYGKKIYLSGLYGTHSDSTTETKEIFERLENTIKLTGSDLKHLVKATYYVSDGKASAELNNVRPQYYDPKRPPAASKAMVKGVGNKDATITMDMIGVIPVQTIE